MQPILITLFKLDLTLFSEVSQTIKTEVVQIIYEQKRPGGALY